MRRVFVRCVNPTQRTVIARGIASQRDPANAIAIRGCMVDPKAWASHDAVDDCPFVW
jgi:hypothetical protein